MPVITPIYASLIALLFLYLAQRTIAYRGAARISLGDGDDPILRRRMRAHGNCAEYAPIALVLLLFVELQGLPGWSVHGLGLLLLAGRLLHGAALTFTGLDARLRILGMGLTLTQIGLSASILLLRPLFA